MSDKIRPYFVTIDQYGGDTNRQLICKKNN